MNITEKAAYIKGLMEGLELDGTKKETKVLNALLELVTELADEVSDLNNDMDQVYDDIDQVYEEIDAIDKDLDDIEECLYEDDCDCGCEDDEEFEDGLYEIRCPNCGEVVCVDEDMLMDENLACPNCNTDFEIDFSDDCDGDCEGGCGCGCHDKE